MQKGQNFFVQVPVFLVGSMMVCQTRGGPSGHDVQPVGLPTASSCIVLHDVCSMNSPDDVPALTLVKGLDVPALRISLNLASTSAFSSNPYRLFQHLVSPFSDTTQLTASLEVFLPSGALVILTDRRGPSMALASSTQPHIQWYSLSQIPGYSSKYMLPS